MPTKLKRVQVTIDEELEAALDRLDPLASNRSRQLRDLALRGAELERAERQARSAATATLLAIARGEIEIDFTGAAEAHALREAYLG